MDPSSESTSAAEASRPRRMFLTANDGGMSRRRSSLGEVDGRPLSGWVRPGRGATYSVVGKGWSSRGDVDVENAEWGARNHPGPALTTDDFVFPVDLFGYPVPATLKAARLRPGRAGSGQRGKIEHRRGGTHRCG